MEMNIQANLVSQLCQRKDITVIENAPMRSYTSFQIGGPADLLVMPQTAEGLSYSLSLLQKAGIPVTVIGAGSNLLVADAGIRGAVVRLSPPFSQVIHILIHFHILNHLIHSAFYSWYMMILLFQP